MNSDYIVYSKRARETQVKQVRATPNDNGEVGSQSQEELYDSDETQIESQQLRAGLSFVPDSEYESQTHEVKKRRGKTACNSVELATKRGEKLHVDISSDGKEAIGKNARKFVNYCGLIVRSNAKLSVQKWSKMEEAEVEKLFDLVEEKFTSIHKQGLRDIMWMKMNSAHSSWQYREREKYLSLPDEQRNSYVPQDVNSEDWARAVQYWTSHDFQEMSKRNKQNRGKVEVKNTCGSRTHAEVAEYMRDPLTGQMKSHDEVYYAQHTKKNKEGQTYWPDPKSKAIYSTIKELVEAGTTLTYAEIVRFATGKCPTKSSRRTKKWREEKAALRSEIEVELQQQFNAKLAEEKNKFEDNISLLQAKYEVATREMRSA